MALRKEGNGTFFLCTQNIEDEVRRAIRQAGYRLRPYVLRSYFESHLLSAQFKKILDPEAGAFFGGHKGTIVRTYTLNKHRLPKELFLSLKQRYLEASSFLTGEEITREAIEEKLAIAKQEGFEEARKEAEKANRDLVLRFKQELNKLREDNERRIAQLYLRLGVNEQEVQFGSDDAVPALDGAVKKASQGTKIPNESILRANSQEWPC